MGVATPGLLVFDFIRRQAEQVSKQLSSVTFDSAFGSGFLPRLSSCLPPPSDGLLLSGSLSEVEPFFPKLLLLMVFHASNSNPDQDRHWHQDCRVIAVKDMTMLCLGFFFFFGGGGVGGLWNFGLEKPFSEEF